MFSPPTSSQLKLDISKSLPPHIMLRKTLRKVATARLTEGARRAYKNLYTDLFSYHFRFANGQIRVLITIARTLPQALRASSLPDGAFWILTLKYKVLFGTMYSIPQFIFDKVNAFIRITAAVRVANQMTEG